MNKCLVCQTETTNPKFCGRSCSTTHNNLINPRRRKTKQCPCGVLVLSNRKYCKDCRNNLYKDWTSITKGDIKNKAKYQVHAYIRQLARTVYRKLNPKPSCQVCGYTNHVEVCHIKPIKDYDDSTPVATINSEDNLVGLCPNHHWELDNDLLTLP